MSAYLIDGISASALELWWAYTMSTLAVIIARVMIDMLTRHQSARQGRYGVLESAVNRIYGWLVGSVFGFIMAALAASVREITSSLPLLPNAAAWTVGALAIAIFLVSIIPAGVALYACAVNNDRL